MQQEKWRPKQVYHYIQWKDIEPDFVVDVSQFIDKKMEAIKAYKSQFFDAKNKAPQTPISSQNFLDSVRYRAQNLGRLAGVEVLKGAAAITQGPYTIGGAINMLSTPIPEEQSGFVNQEIGENGTQRTHVTYGNSTENFGFLLEGHIWDTDGFDTIQDESGDTGFEKDDFVAKFRLNSDRGAAIYQELNFK